MSQPEPELEIHCAAEHGPQLRDLRRTLTALGFRDDGLDSAGMVLPQYDGAEPMSSCPLTALHVTWDTRDRAEYRRMRHEISDALDHYRGDGYAHAEVIRPGWDVDLVPQPFDAAVGWPLPYLRRVFGGDHKRWDIHISARLETLDDGLQARLADQAGMYYIDLHKPRGIERIFTVQGTTSIRAGLEIFAQLTNYLLRAGGMDGAIKLEQTTWMRVFGRPGIVPPTVSVRRDLEPSATRVDSLWS